MDFQLWEYSQHTQRLTKKSKESHIISKFPVKLFHVSFMLFDIQLTQTREIYFTIQYKVCDLDCTLIS